MPRFGFGLDASGKPQHATITTAPVANTTAGLFTFSQGASEAYLTNYSGVTCYVKLGGTSADPAKTLDWTFQIPNGGERSIGIGCKTISIWWGAGATLNAQEDAGGSSAPATYGVWGWCGGNPDGRSDAL